MASKLKITLIFSYFSAIQAVPFLAYPCLINTKFRVISTYKHHLSIKEEWMVKQKDHLTEKLKSSFTSEIIHIYLVYMVTEIRRFMLDNIIIFSTL